MLRLAVVILLGLFIAGAAIAEDLPAALVTDYDGEPNPAFEINSEIFNGTDLTVGPNSMVTLYHYRVCQSARFVGGRIGVTIWGVTTHGDATAALVGITSCPNEIRFAIEGGMMAKIANIAPLPDCVVVGKRRHAVGAIQLSAGDKPVLTLPVVDNVAAVPAAQKALAEGGGYTLSILDQDNKVLKSLPAMVSPDFTAKKCIIRVN